MAKAKIELSELIDYVAKQLLQANEKAAERGEHAMTFAECELEMAVELEKSGGLGLQIHVLNIGAGAKKVDSNTIRVKFVPIGGAPLINFMRYYQSPESEDRSKELFRSLGQEERPTEEETGRPGKTIRRRRPSP